MSGKNIGITIGIIVMLAAGALYGAYRQGVFTAQTPAQTTYSLSGTVESFDGDKLYVHHTLANKFPGVTDVQTVIVTADTPVVFVDRNGDALVRTNAHASDIAIGGPVVIYAAERLPSPLEVRAERVDIVRF